MTRLDQSIKIYFENLDSTNKELQFEAYTKIMDATTVEVDWAYEVWDELLADLTHSSNHRRSRAAQFLSNLAISDYEKRILNDFSSLWEVTKDEKFVTARHSLQTIWRVGLAGPLQKEMVINHLVDRYRDCEKEKNYTLIRFDIIQDLKKLYDVVQEDEIKQTALDLIDLEKDKKYQKKYAGVWKKK